MVRIHAGLPNVRGDQCFVLSREFLSLELHGATVDWIDDDQFDD